jgi:hypothetical protein
MNANYGLMPPLTVRARDRQKKLAMGDRALAALDGWALHHGLVTANGSDHEAAALCDDSPPTNGSLHQP